MSFISDITAGTPTTGVWVGGLPSGVDNDQGNIRDGGNVSETDRWSSNALGEGNPITTISSGVNNTFALGPGTFNNQPSQDIMRVTTTLAGVSNNALLAGSSNSADSSTIHQLAVMKVRLYKTAVRNGDWNEYSGWSSVPTVVESGGYDIGMGSDQSSDLKANSTDNAANPTSSVPGEWAEHQGVLGLPTTGNYGARYLW